MTQNLSQARQKQLDKIKKDKEKLKKIEQKIQRNNASEILNIIKEVGIDAETAKEILKQSSNYKKAVLQEKENHLLNKDEILKEEDSNEIK